MRHTITVDQKTEEWLSRCSQGMTLGVVNNTGTLKQLITLLARAYPSGLDADWIQEQNERAGFGRGSSQENSPVDSKIIPFQFYRYSV